MNLIGTTIFLLTMILATIISRSNSYKILSILPFPIKSHYRIFDPIMIELARRGHSVTVLSTFPKSEKIANYTGINIASCYERADNFEFSVDELSKINEDSLWLIDEISRYIDLDEAVLECESFKRFLAETAKERYDLVMTEYFISHTFLGIIGRFNYAPLIALSPNTLTPWDADALGAIDNPSYIPMVFNYRSMDPKNPTFYERLLNVYMYALFKFSFYYIFEPKSQRLADRFNSPEQRVRLRDISSNVSLVLSYSHFLTNVPRPQLPNVIGIGGINVGEARPLEQNIKKFIDESKHGVIYFSMGSLLQTKSFPEAKINAFMKAFSELPQRILWKWEGDFPNQTDKVKTLKWMPQRDILAHPNVKLFISHGGSTGINEAMCEGVPVLGIPIYSDQRTNLMMMRSAGAAEILDYTTISYEIVSEKLNLMLNNPSYRENGKHLSLRYKDRLISPMDSAIYWIEYVIRHKGAHHLRSAATNLTWYQYLLLDVISFILVVSVVVLLVSYYFFKFLLLFLIRHIKKILCNIKIKRA